MKWTIVTELGIEFEIYYNTPPAGVDVQLVKVGGVNVTPLANSSMIGAYKLIELITEKIEHQIIQENEQDRI